MKPINSGFIADFKLGDNIVYNLKTLGLLYKYYNQENDYDKQLLHKIMIILIGSCTEAILSDFYGRIRKRPFEVVTGLDDNTIKSIQDLKKIDRFAIFIKYAQKENIFNGVYSEFYSDLRDLSNLRNRIHIQNDKSRFEPDDIKAFTADRLKQAEKALETVVKTMAKDYLRWEGFNYVKDVKLPWSPHFDE